MANEYIAGLLSDARCFRCLPDKKQYQIQAYLLAYIAGLPLDPAALLVEAKDLESLTEPQLIAIRAFLLASSAEFDTSASYLSNLARCYYCIPRSQMVSVQTYLWTNDPNGPGITDPGQLEAAAKCFCGLTEFEALRIQVCALADITGVPCNAAMLEAEASCLICVPYLIQVTIAIQVTDFLEPIPPGSPRNSDPPPNPDPPGNTHRGGGIPQCTNDPATLIPVITANYSGGLITTIDILFPKVCCQPGTYQVYGSNVADMSGAALVTSGPTGGNHGQANVTVSGVDVSSYGYMYYAVKQVCRGGLPVSAYSNVVTANSPNGLLNSLEAYWKMDEALPVGGTRVDATGSGLDLTDVLGDIRSSAALINNGAFFDPPTVSMRLSHADVAALSAGPGVSFTVSLWMYYTNSINFNIPLVSKWQTATTDLEFILRVHEVTDKHLLYKCRNLANTTTVTIDSGSDVTNLTWYHIVFGYDDAAGQMFLQINNGPRLTAPIVGVQHSPSDFTLGNYSYAGLQSTWGKMDEVGFWHRALSLADVSALYNGGAGLPYGGFTA